MLRLSIIDTTFDPEFLFAECELDVVEEKGMWVDGSYSCHFAALDRTHPAKTRHFRVELTGDRIADFDGASRFVFFAGGSNADIKGTAKISKKSNIGRTQKKIVCSFVDSRKRKTNSDDSREFRLVRDIMFSSKFVLQWESGEGQVKSISLPIDVEADEADVKRYDLMSSELAQQGLFSFIYNDLQGLFSRNRLSLSWDHGSSRFQGQDHEVELRAIDEVWKKLSYDLIPSLLRSPIWESRVSRTWMPTERIRRFTSSALNKIIFGGPTPLYALGKTSSVTFSTETHIVIYSFLVKELRRHQLVSQALFDSVDKKLKDDLDRENGKEDGNYHPDVVNQLTQKIRDNNSRYEEHMKREDSMKEFLLRLGGTEVFREIWSKRQLSYHDVSPVVFSVDPTYRRIFALIKEFDERYFNWRSRGRSRERYAAPIQGNESGAAEFGEWKYSKMYQYWVYYQFCCAALGSGLKLADRRNFHAGDGSWVLFESTDGIQFKIFHEIKGRARRILEEESSSSPLDADAWCASEWNADDYATPDFAIIVSHADMEPFLIMADAKTPAKWNEDEHGKSQRKYCGFRRLLKGYNGNGSTPGKAILTRQSWIVYPSEGKNAEIDESGPWQFAIGERGPILQCAAGSSKGDVCLGRLKGLFNQRKSVEPFVAFFKAQLAYCRDEIAKRHASN